MIKLKTYGIDKKNVDKFELPYPITKNLLKKKNCIQVKKYNNN